MLPGPARAMRLSAPPPFRVRPGIHAVTVAASLPQAHQLERQRHSLIASAGRQEALRRFLVPRDVARDSRQDACDTRGDGWRYSVERGLAHRCLCARYVVCANGPHVGRQDERAPAGVVRGQVVCERLQLRREGCPVPTVGEHVQLQGAGGQTGRGRSRWLAIELRGRGSRLLGLRRAPRFAWPERPRGRRCSRWSTASRPAVPKARYRPSARQCECERWRALPQRAASVRHRRRLPRLARDRAWPMPARTARQLSGRPPRAATRR